jgi:hypothetical protein
MRPKQKEMDEAVEEIYNIIEKQDAQRILHDNNAKGTLMVLCGDHGMNEVRLGSFQINVCILTVCINRKEIMEAHLLARLLL